MSFSESDDDLDFDAIDALEVQATSIQKKKVIVLVSGCHIRWALDEPYVRRLIRHDPLDVFDPVWTLVWGSSGEFEIPKDLDVSMVVMRPTRDTFLEVVQQK